MPKVYVERWEPELCLRGYLYEVDVPEEVDWTAGDFDPSEYPFIEVEFLGATDVTLPDPENHPADLTVHGTDKAEALKAAMRGDWG